MIEIAIASAAAACGLGLHILLELKTGESPKQQLIPVRDRDNRDRHHAQSDPATGAES